MTQVCGTGTWGTAPKPGDPDNNSILTAKPAFGGIDVMWTFPEVNPHGVAYVNLYRGTSDEVAYAVRHAVVTGDFFYDKTTTTTPIEYFYWIEIVSVNGTHGELIGPASAIARPTIEQVMDGLSSQIDAGMLSQSLKQQLDRIELTDQRISEEILERARSIATLGDSIELIQLEVDGAVSAINEETAQRQDAHDAFVGQLNQMYATLDGSITAAIQEEQLARATEDEALATQIQTLSAQTADNLSAAIQSERQAWTSANEALSSQMDTLFTSLDDKFTAAIQDEQSARISANEAIAESLNTLTTVSSDNAAAIEEERQARVSADTAIVESIDTLYSTVGDDIEAAVQAERAARTDSQSAMATSFEALVAQTAEDLNAAIQTESTARSDAVEAVTAQLTTLESRVNDDVFSAINTEQTARVAADEALAAQIDTTQTALGDGLATVRTDMSTEVTRLDDRIDAASSDITTVQTSLGDQISSVEQSLTTTISGLDMGNLVKNGSFETDNFEGWTHNNLGSVGSRYRTDRLERPSGSGDFRDAYLTFPTNTDSAAEAISPWVPCSPGESYGIQAEVAAAGNAPNGGVRLRFLFEDVDGNRTWVNGPYQTFSVSNGWTLMDVVSATVPAGAVRVRFRIQQGAGGIGYNIASLRAWKVDAVLGAQYTAKVQTNGLVGGFGVYNDGKEVEAGFDVDRFWVGKSGNNKRKPFIIENNETFIDEAVINKLTFSKLRDASGNFVVNSNGKIKASYIDANNLSVKESATFTGTAQSSNFPNGGWRLQPGGGFDLRSASSGARLRIAGDRIEVHDSNGRLRVRLGRL